MEKEDTGGKTSPKSHKIGTLEVKANPTIRRTRDFSGSETSKKKK